MGPLLRGDMGDTDEDTEGPAKEALIVQACERDRWPASVLACVASATEPTAQKCLDALPAEMLARYDSVLEKYGSSRDALDDAPPELSCEDAFGATSVEAWPPAVTDEAQRSLAAKLRRPPLESQCDDTAWSAEVRSCIAGRPSTGMDACLSLLDSADRVAAEKVIKEADDLRAAIVKALATPKNVTCAKAVEVHYAPAKWMGKAPELTGAARRQAITASKKALLAHCMSEWTIEARACVVASDSDACRGLGALGASWGYPAALASPNRPPSDPPGR